MRRSWGMFLINMVSWCLRLQAYSEAKCSRLRLESLLRKCHEYPGHDRWQREVQGLWVCQLWETRGCPEGTGGRYFPRWGSSPWTCNAQNHARFSVLPGNWNLRAGRTENPAGLQELEDRDDDHRSKTRTTLFCIALFFFFAPGCGRDERERDEWETDLRWPRAEESGAAGGAQAQIWADETGPHDSLPGQILKKLWPPLSGGTLNSCSFVKFNATSSVGCIGQIGCNSKRSSWAPPFFLMNTGDKYVLLTIMSMEHVATVEHVETVHVEHYVEIILCVFRVSTCMWRTLTMESTMSVYERSSPLLAP